MSIAYIILTCEKNINTYVLWQKNTFLKNINKNDIYYISAKNDSENSIYGWNTIDTYDSCPIKYMYFIKNMDINYDWYLFIDDDSFCNTVGISEYLKKFDNSDKLYIGKIVYNTIHYMTGGAGFILSKQLYNELKKYIINIDDEQKLIKNIHGDMSLGLWLYNIKNIKYINASGFNQNMHSNENQLDNFLTFHYVKKLEHFEFYDNICNSTLQNISNNSFEIIDINKIYEKQKMFYILKKKYKS